MHVDCWFDGACWPNPNGHAASGAFIKHEGVVIYSGSRYIGCQGTTNNVAEYDGLNLILEKLVELQPASAMIYGDSDLVIKQMTGRWKVGRLTRSERNGKTPVKVRHYIPYYYKAVDLLGRIQGNVDFVWISRDLNDQADLLSRQPLEDRKITNPYERMFT